MAATLEAVTACLQANQLPEARQLCTQLCSAEPDNADAWFLLGILQAQAGELTAAEQSWRKTTALQPGSHAAWGNLGAVLLMQGRHTDARQCLEQALHINPQDPATLNTLGNLQRDLGDWQAALHSYQQALAFNPDYAEAHNNLGNVYHDRAQLSQALACYQRAVELQPDYVDALFNLAAVYQKRGDNDAAMAGFERVLAVRPGYADADAAIADIHEKQGHHEQAWARLQPLAAQGRMTPRGATTWGVVARRLGHHDEAITAMQAQLARTDLPLMLRQELQFGLGDLYNDCDRYDEAFSHYREANSLRPYAWDRQRQQDTIDALQQVFDNSGQPLAQATNRSQLPVFIVGMPRSGTSLVEQILASHPQVHGGGELDGISDLTNSLPARFSVAAYPAGAAALDASQLETLAQTWLAELTALAPEAARITDKMPHNFLHLGFIAQLYPGARVIHCQRDPLDTCLSIYFHNFNVNHPYASDLQALGLYYREYERLMVHWRKNLSIPLLEISYEELVADQERISREMVDFCELDWDERCLTYYESERQTITPSYDQVRQPIYTRSVQRWKHYAAWLEPLQRALGQQD